MNRTIELTGSSTEPITSLVGGDPIPSRLESGEPRTKSVTGVDLKAIDRKPIDLRERLRELTEGKDRYPYNEILAFKTELERQVYGYAFLSTRWVINSVREEPRIDRSKLKKRLDGLIRDLSLGAEQEFITLAFFNAFMDRHQLMLDVYDRNAGNPQAIFLEVFGRPPAGKVEVILGPSVLHFRCHNPKDYALVYSGKFASSVDTTQEDIERASRTSGCHISLVWQKEFYGGGITLENVQSGNGNSSWEQAIYKHEETHALNTLFLKVATTGIDVKRFQELKRVVGTEEFDYKLRQYMRDIIRRSKETLAGDEILAYLRMGYGFEQVYSILTATADQGGLYDYFGEYRKEGNGLEEFLVKQFGTSCVEQIREAIQKVFVDEYHNHLKAGLDSVRRLIVRGYSVEEIQAVLAQIPLEQWTKWSRRLAAERLLPRERFWLPGQSGYKVVAFGKDGVLYGVIELKHYDGATGMPVLSTVAGGDNQPKAILSFEEYTPYELQELNYPFKTLDLWYQIWVKAGGDPNVKPVQIDSESAAELVSADVAWGVFRDHCPPGSNAHRVFATYRELLRAVY